MTLQEIYNQIAELLEKENANIEAYGHGVGSIFRKLPDGSIERLWFDEAEKARGGRNENVR